MSENNNEYSPIRCWWKYTLSFFVILFLVAILIVTCLTFKNFLQFNPSCEISCLMILHAIISIGVCICFFLCIKKLINIFAQNLERENNILASLYQEQEKRKIIRNDKEEIEKLREEIKKDLDKEKQTKVIQTPPTS